MRPKIFWNNFLILFSTFRLISSLISSEQFTETLLISPLPNGDLFSLFNFTVVAHPEQAENAPSRQHPVLVPRLLQHLANQFNVTDLRLSLAQGYWRSRLWGAQVPGTEVPSGNELIAQFGTNPGNYSQPGIIDDPEDHKWSSLVHTLNGLFCASILQLLPQHSSNPKFVFGKGAPAGELWFWGTLGGESVCTENIKAWKNLLPCKQNGLVSLLDPIQLLSAKFHAISLKLTQMERDCWHFSMLFQTVHSGEMCQEKAKKGISLIQSLFGRELNNECAVATKSSINIAQNELFGLKVSKNSTEIVNQNFVEFHAEQKVENIGTFRLTSPNFHTLQMNSENIIVHSHVKSVNQIGGRISTQISNPLPIPLISALFAHQIPWHLRIFLHTLEVKCRTSNETQNAATKTQNFELAFFTLARDRARPLLMELRIDIPAMSNCLVDVDYEAAFLRIADFPPDASSGIFVPGALLQIPIEHNPMLAQLLRKKFPFPLLEVRDQQQRLRLFGEPLLVLLPIPDFSMPFNVICLVCTAIAIYYGNAVALSTKLMVPMPKKESNEAGKSSDFAAARQGILSRLRCRMAAKFGSIFRIFQRRPTGEEKEE